MPTSALTPTDGLKQLSEDDLVSMATAIGLVEEDYDIFGWIAVLALQVDPDAPYEIEHTAGGQLCFRDKASGHIMFDHPELLRFQSLFANALENKQNEMMAEIFGANRDYIKSAVVLQSAARMWKTRKEIDSRRAELARWQQEKRGEVEVHLRRGVQGRDPEALREALALAAHYQRGTRSLNMQPQLTAARAMLLEVDAEAALQAAVDNRDTEELQMAIANAQLVGVTHAVLDDALQLLHQINAEFLMLQSSAALLIQAVARGFVGRHLLRKDLAARCIQSRVRACLSRARLSDMLAEDHRAIASRTLQRYTRTLLYHATLCTAVEEAHRVTAACVLQASLRAALGRLRAGFMMEERLKLAAARTLQAVARRRLGRAELEGLLQEEWRQCCARVLQAVVRRALGAHALAAVFDERRRVAACIKLQAVAHGCLGRAVARRLRCERAAFLAARTVQAVCRGYVGRQRALQRREDIRLDAIRRNLAAAMASRDIALISTAIEESRNEVEEVQEAKELICHLVALYEGVQAAMAKDDGDALELYAAEAENLGGIQWPELAQARHQLAQRIAATVVEATLSMALGECTNRQASRSSVVIQAVCRGFLARRAKRRVKHEKTQRLQHHALSVLQQAVTSRSRQAIAEALQSPALADVRTHDVVVRAQAVQAELALLSHLSDAIAARSSVQLATYLARAEQMKLVSPVVVEAKRVRAEMDCRQNLHNAMERKDPEQIRVALANAERMGLVRGEEQEMCASANNMLTEIVTQRHLTEAIESRDRRQLQAAITKAQSQNQRIKSLPVLAEAMALLQSVVDEDLALQQLEAALEKQTVIAISDAVERCRRLGLHARHSGLLNQAQAVMARIRQHESTLEAVREAISTFSVTALVDVLRVAEEQSLETPEIASARILLSQLRAFRALEEAIASRTLDLLKRSLRDAKAHELRDSPIPRVAELLEEAHVLIKQLEKEAAALKQLKQAMALRTEAALAPAVAQCVTLLMDRRMPEAIEPARELLKRIQMENLTRKRLTEAETGTSLSRLHSALAAVTRLCTQYGLAGFEEKRTADLSAKRDRLVELLRARNVAMENCDRVALDTWLRKAEKAGLSPADVTPALELRQRLLRQEAARDSLAAAITARTEDALVEAIDEVREAFAPRAQPIASSSASSVAAADMGVDSDGLDFLTLDDLDVRVGRRFSASEEPGDAPSVEHTVDLSASTAAAPSSSGAASSKSATGASSKTPTLTSAGECAASSVSSPDSTAAGGRAWPSAGPRARVPRKDEVVPDELAAAVELLASVRHETLVRQRLERAISTRDRKQLQVALEQADCATPEVMTARRLIEEIDMLDALNMAMASGAEEALEVCLVQAAAMGFTHAVVDKAQAQLAAAVKYRVLSVRSAVFIQSHFRGFRCRVEIARRKHWARMHNGATTIQSVARAFTVRNQVARYRRAHRAALKIQAVWRGFYLRGLLLLRAELQALADDAARTGANVPLLVFLRIRPPLGLEGNQSTCLRPLDENTVRVQVGLRKQYDSTLHYVFTREESQLAVFVRFQHLLKFMAMGNAACFIGYGQTGTGKTHTILGSNLEKTVADSHKLLKGAVSASGSYSAERKDPWGSGAGLIPRSIGFLFEHLRILESSDAPDTVPKGNHEGDMLPCADGSTANIAVNVLEIYNDKIYDLLLSAKQKQEKSLKIKKVGTATVVQGLKTVYLHHRKQVLQLIAMYTHNRRLRHSRSHNRNKCSHLIVQVTTTRRGRPSADFPEERGEWETTGNIVTQGRLALVDLAGSEKFTATPATSAGAVYAQAEEAEKVAEGRVVAESLQSLASCLALIGHHDTTSDFSYRESKLTHVLQDYVGGCATLPVRVALVATVGSCMADNDEINNTVRFAERAKQMMAEARRRVDAGTHETVRQHENKLESEIGRLKAALAHSSLSHVEQHRRQLLMCKNELSHVREKHHDPNSWGQAVISASVVDTSERSSLLDVREKARSIAEQGGAPEECVRVSTAARRAWGSSPPSTARRSSLTVGDGGVSKSTLPTLPIPPRPPSATSSSARGSSAASSISNLSSFTARSYLSDRSARSDRSAVSAVTSDSSSLASTSTTAQLSHGSQAFVPMPPGHALAAAAPVPASGWVGNNLAAAAPPPTGGTGGHKKSPRMAFVREKPA